MLVDTQGSNLINEQVRSSPRAEKLVWQHLIVGGVIIKR